MRPRQPARHNLRLWTSFPAIRATPFLDEKAFNEVQVEQEVVLEELCVEEAATSLPPRSLQLMLSRRQPPFSPAS